MKILQVLCAGGQAGIPTVARAFQKCWQAAGHECDIVSLDKNEDEWLHPPGLLSSYRLAKMPLLAPVYNYWADQLFNTKKYDVVMAQYPPLDRFFMKAARKRNKLTSYFYQNVTDPKFYEGEETSRRIDEDNRYLEGVRAADLAFTASAYSAVKVKEKTGLDAQVIPLGVNCDFWQAPPTIITAPVLVTLGRVSRHKGVKELMQSFALVQKEIPEARLKVIGAMGDKSYAKECQELATEGVEFLGRLSDENILKHFQTSSLFVSATLFEGFGLPFLEAAACGLPSVGFSLCSVPEVVKQGKTGLLCPPGNLQEFSQAIISLLKEPVRREEMGKKAIEWAAEFSWQKSAQKIIELVEKQQLSN